MKTHFIVFGLLLIGQLSITHAQELQHQTGFVQLTENSPLVLGRGISSVNAEPRGDCLDMPPAGPTQQNGQLVTQNSTIITNRNQMDTFLEISVSMQANSLAGWGASASLQMSHSLNINTYGVIYVTKVNVLNEGALAKEVQLKPSVLVEVLKQVDPVSYFLETCGDSYVSKIITGGDFYASLSVSTKSSQETSTASDKLSGSYSLVSGDARFTSNVKSLQESSSVKISMVRSGGNAVELLNSIDDLTKRAAAFPAEVAAAPWRLRAITQSYAAVFNLPEAIRTVLRQTRRNLTGMVQAYNRASEEIDRINFITSHSNQFFLDPFDIPKLANEITILIVYRDEIKGRIEKCVNQGADCGGPVPVVPTSQIYPGRR